MRITFFGDFVCQNPVRTAIGPELRHIIDASDFNVVNFEAPVKASDALPIRKSGPNICQPVESVYWLEENGFNVVALANNHMLDFGIESAIATQRAFKKAAMVGFGENNGAYNHVVLEHDGVRVAIMSVTHREFSCAEDFGTGCAWMCSPQVQFQIGEIKRNADRLVVVCHGGLEYFDYPLPQYRSLYKSWVDFGADAVIASHPHVPQGWEEYNGKPIFYSLGNFCFEKTEVKTPRHWNESLAVTMNSSSDGIAYDVANVSYNPSTAMIDIETGNEKHIELLNRVLRDRELYDDAILDGMKSFAPTYDWMLSAGGYSRIGFTKSYLKALARFVLRRKVGSIHHLNMYRCETHRWVMEYLLSHNML